VDNGLLPTTPRSSALHTVHSCSQGIPSSAESHLLPPPLRPTTGLAFSGSDLSGATVLGQIDHKFICVLIPPYSARAGQTLVLIDQHAADERVSVEAILKDLCDGFVCNAVPVTQLREPLPAIILSRQDTEVLCAPGVTEVFARWGVQLDTSQAKSLYSQDGGYVQIPVKAVPAALSRLGKKDGAEMTRLVKLYLADLELGLGQIAALLQRTSGAVGSATDVDWGEALRWMPKEMLELANSKACRSESCAASWARVKGLMVQMRSCLEIVSISSSARGWSDN
jgi:DNA mismatch repair protein MLH3